MKYHVIVLTRAKKMLASHMQFLSKVNKSAATKKRAEILAAIRSLSQQPFRYPTLDSEFFRGEYHKMFVPQWYLLLYTIVEDTVYVDYILDCRTDYSWLLDEA